MIPQRRNGSSAQTAAWRIPEWMLPGRRRQHAMRHNPNEELPLRAELFSATQMEQHGRVLAEAHQVSTVQTRDQLLPRLSDNAAILAHACGLLREAIKAGWQVAPAAEWLLDNYYLIEEQIRTARQHLPRSYSHELPSLKKGASAGFPRVYDIALETISHGDGRVDPEGLRRFVAAYQQVTVLKLGELWAIPIMLRLALIENLRRVGARLAAGRAHRNLADAWADRMIEIGNKDPGDLILVVADMARSNPPIESSFVAEFMRRLQGQGPTFTLPLNWLAQHVAETGSSIEELIQVENQQQAADQVSISNSIGSLRFLGSVDWREFVETMSVVEQTLREDSAGVYADMDFATRDRYRHTIERIARHTTVSEADIANYAIELAKQGAHKNGAAHYRAHVGYFLIGDGVTQLEQLSRMRMSVAERLRRRVDKRPLVAYLGPIFILSALFTFVLLSQVSGSGRPLWLEALIGAVALVATSHLAIALVNWLITLRTMPRPLPRMDFSDGIPSEYSTLVVVPTLLLDRHNVDQLCDALEIRFLANRDDNLRFCLLTDFADAATETTNDDEGLLALARRNIEKLNEKYTDGADSGRGDKFLLLHRPRRWNPRENVWMGWERKRGKLANLNSFLRDTAPNPFSFIVGDTEGLSGVKYVITLDTDTELARDSARQFIATMAHPLNRPHFSETHQRVTEGYGILQPRVSTSLPSESATRYGLLYGGEPGIDPYTRTVSDVYQDVFREGSFIGKGIYDVDIFEQALATRFPENRVLSHDLLEGCHARCGLISDVQLHEEYPTRYSADVSRRHRWIRGDWQLASWIWRKNSLSTLSRWKLLDNLRRSLVNPALVFLLVAGWIIVESPWLWTASVAGIIFIPQLMASLIDLLRKPDDVLPRQHLAATGRFARQRLAQVSLTFVFLPYDAWFSLDAIARTLWRLLVSRRRLLEWNPSHVVIRSANTDLPAYYRRMWFSPAIAIVTAAVLARLGLTEAATAATPVLLLWLSGPWIAWWVSQPLTHEKLHLAPEKTAFLHRLARKTWAFFETYIGPDDNWLPPDNVQVAPVASVAHRTSPTNIGLALLASLAARDFGYISCGQLIDRTANTLRTMGAMERYKGHFYNWYDTLQLKPLLPLYVSTVDSGNLAGHLLTLRAGLLSLPDQPVISPRGFAGIEDTFSVLCEYSADGIVDELRQFQTYLSFAQHACAPTPQATWQCLQKLLEYAEAIQARADAVPLPPLTRWAHALARQCREARDDLELLAPWCSKPDHPQADFEWQRLIHTIPTLHALAGFAAKLETLETSAPPPAELALLITQGSRNASDRIDQINDLASQITEFSRMDFGFLYNETTRLLAIGYNVSDRRRDTAYYDLLASEARLGSFVGIAQAELPQENWFALGRQLTIAGGDPVLLSWSGSMFEYLMPLLVMPRYDNTLLDQTYDAAVQRQIDYGNQRGIPWGFSESGYYTFDASLNYQYRAFGVPGLGLKRGLGDDLVIAPYASMLALMVAPEAACANLQRLEADGFGGEFGFYEAIDYTPARLPRGQTHAVVESYMSHHQGMGLLSLGYLLLDQPMQEYFGSDPLFQATMLLLQERIPKATATYFNTSELADIRLITGAPQLPMRILKRADTRRPEVQLLSNGRYHVMVTNSGGSSSRWRDLSVTRWHEDCIRDHWGAFCYVRDVANGAFWSTTYQPTLRQPDRYEVILSEDRAEFRRHDHGIDLHTEIVVSPEDDVEVRRTRVTNRSRMRRTIEVTSYCEVVLAPAPADAAHPAFGNLFVQTEILAPRHAVICTRRPRSENERAPWMFNLMTIHDDDAELPSFETDRARFIGRGNSVAAPAAMSRRGPLSGTQGSVLDPIVAIRYEFTLNPEQSVSINTVIGVTETRAQTLSLVDKYQDRYLTDRVFELAWTHNHVVLRQLNASDADAQLYGRMANSIVYANPILRADPNILMRNRQQQSGLWGYGISGDLPIVLFQIRNVGNIDMVRQLIQAHAYWRQKGLAVDLVIWNEDHASYRQALQDQIMGLIISGIEAPTLDRPGGIFVRMVDQITNEDRILMQSVARIIFSDNRGTLAEQLGRRRPPELVMPALEPLVAAPGMTPSGAAKPLDATQDDLVLFNGLGGFSADGREYVIITESGKPTPAPWVNVLANPVFGSVISESGQGYTWYGNAHEFRLTPWDNDPISDVSGEAFYIRNEISGHVWSPTPLPCRGHGTYVTRHGFGYSVFEHAEHGISTELTVYVALEAPIKYSVLKVRNDTDETQVLSATAYAEWVLGDHPAKTTMHVVTETGPAGGALLARNAYSPDFPGLTAFLDVDATRRTMTGDRAEFIGRNSSVRNPAALGRTRLSGKTGAGFDPCGAIQVPLELLAGQEREIVFMIGAAKQGNGEAARLVQRYGGATAAHEALAAVRRHWEDVLGAVQIETPLRSLDILANGWLIYQVIASRLWARSGYYQSGGAYGFRDQLQDVMALIHTEPRLMREHLLRAAAHQFVEGDVQHWWHPPSDRGVRTHCSDDYLWLPLATCRYVESTGDASVLDEIAGFLEGRPLGPDEDSYYDLPNHSAESASLYEHCVRAILYGLKFGVHGLPLIGSGDWNDGMDKVGAQGRGESVWLGFFLYEVLTRFSNLAKGHGDAVFAQRCLDEAARLRVKLEQNGWDGNWYRRAYFDDGTPLGSSSNPECQIDSISQSWSVLSGAGDPRRCISAMQAVNERLVKREHRLIQLLDPPFDDSPLNPGYIRGYVPGIRENGGQYTHAAIWTVMAFAKLRDARTAWELMALINPINHGATAEDIAVYKTEPYVVAADVYASPQHDGRGGWTWYTGSASWMYRLIVESLLGLERLDDALTVTPCIPAEWTSFKLRYRYGASIYRIEVRRATSPAAPQTVTIPLVDDGGEHTVEVELGRLADYPVERLAEVHGQ